MQTTTFKSFTDLAAFVQRTENASAVKAAANLKRSRSIAKVKPGTGPRIAKAVR